MEGQHAEAYCVWGADYRAKNVKGVRRQEKGLDFIGFQARAVQKHSSTEKLKAAYS
jgi:hypothetical protein